jgi:hypothetical protein
MLLVICPAADMCQAGGPGHSGTLFVGVGQVGVRCTPTMCRWSSMPWIPALATFSSPSPCIHQVSSRWEASCAHACHPWHWRMGSATLVCTNPLNDTISLSYLHPIAAFKLYREILDKKVVKQCFFFARYWSETKLTIISTKSLTTRVCFRNKTTMNLLQSKSRYSLHYSRACSLRWIFDP